MVKCPALQGEAGWVPLARERGRASRPKRLEEGGSLGTFALDLGHGNPDQDTRVYELEVKGG